MVNWARALRCANVHGLGRCCSRHLGRSRGRLQSARSRWSPVVAIPSAAPSSKHSRRRRPRQRQSLKPRSTTSARRAARAATRPKWSAGTARTTIARWKKRTPRRWSAISRRLARSLRCRLALRAPRDRFVVNTEGPDGALHDYEVAYTFGFEPLQQYLVRFPDGRMQDLSVAWDARRATPVDSAGSI